MWAGRKTGKGKRSMRRDRENQSWPACGPARKSGLDPNRVPPYRPAAHACRITRPDTRKHLTACPEPSEEMLASKGASTHDHDEVGDVRGRGVERGPHRRRPSPSSNFGATEGVVPSFPSVAGRSHYASTRRSLGFVLRARRSRAVRACGPGGRRGDAGGADLARSPRPGAWGMNAGDEGSFLLLSIILRTMVRCTGRGGRARIAA